MPSLRQALASRDALTGGVIAVLGAFFFIAAGSIQGFGDDPVGPRFLPRTVCLLMIMLGLALAARSWWRGEADPGAQDSGPSAAVAKVKVAALGVAAVLYAALFYLVGFIFASLLAFPVVLYLFGLRSIVKLSVTTAAAVAVFYSFFFGLLGVPDPPGLWVDFFGLLR